MARTPSWRIRKGFIKGLAAVFLAALCGWLALALCLLRLHHWLGTFSWEIECAAHGGSWSPANDHAAQLRLDLLQSKLRAGEPYPLWYRMELRNSACFTLRSVAANDLIEGARLEVFDERGRPVEFQPPEWNTVQPYSPDRGVISALSADPATNLTSRSSEYIGGLEHWTIDVAPGRSAQSVPSSLLPRLVWLQPMDMGGPPIDTSVADPNMRRVILKHLRGRTFPPPPAGYTLAEGFHFAKPGLYKARVRYSGAFSRDYGTPHWYWYQSHVPQSIRRFLGTLTMITLFQDPSWLLASGYVIGPGSALKLVSNTVEFTVQR